MQLLLKMFALLLQQMLHLPHHLQFLKQSFLHLEELFEGPQYLGQYQELQLKILL